MAYLRVVFKMYFHILNLQICLLLNNIQFRSHYHHRFVTQTMYLSHWMAVKAQLIAFWRLLHFVAACHMRRQFESRIFATCVAINHKYAAIAEEEFPGSLLSGWKIYAQTRTQSKSESQKNRGKSASAQAITLSLPLFLSFLLSLFPLDTLAAYKMEIEFQ